MFDQYYDDSIKNLNKFNCDTGLSCDAESVWK